MNIRKKLVICSFILTVIFILGSVSFVSAASTTTYTINPNKLFNFGNEKIHDDKIYTINLLSDLDPSIDGSCLITNIKFSYRFIDINGSNQNYDWCNIYLKDYYYFMDGMKNVLNVGAKNMTSGQWYDTSCNNDYYAPTYKPGPKYFDQLLIVLGDYPDQGDYFLNKWEFKITEVTFKKSTFDAAITVTPEKYTKITVTKPDAAIPGWLKITNVTTGQSIVNDSLTTDKTTYEYVDMAVNPGKTYIYDIKYNSGNYLSSHLVTIPTTPIIIPSPESLAEEAALQARAAAVEAKDAALASKDISAKALAAAEEARMKVYRVIRGIAFEELSYGELSGRYGDYTNKTNDYLIATTTDGFTVIEGKFITESLAYKKIPLTRSDGTPTFVLIRIIAPPKVSNSAAVSFQ